MKKPVEKHHKQAILAAIKAGEAIMEVYGTEVEVFIKDDRSPLTKADKQAHTVISEMLQPTGYPVLSEEGKTIPFETRSQWPNFWMVDPLDGTKEFIKRNGEFTVNIAFMAGNYPAFGVIYVPVTGELFFGGLGYGSYKLIRAKDLVTSDESDLSGSTVLPTGKPSSVYRIIASRSHMSPETEARVEEMKKLKGEVGLLSKGSSLKLCMIAEGLADEYPRFAPTMEWDTAAGQAIVEGAGGEVLHYHSGKRLPYNKENLLNDWFLAQNH